MMRTVRAICIILLIVAAPGTPAADDRSKVDSEYWTDKYDQYFRKYTKRYFGDGFDWRWFKAQAIVESSLKHDAESWANAKGIMQIMPDTFHDIKKANPSFVDINEPRWNIAAAIYYDRQLYDKWTADRPFEDRINFMFASYNAGFGTILRAQHECKKRGLNENLWSNIKAVAPVVANWRHKETLAYVVKINWMMK